MYFHMCGSMEASLTCSDGQKRWRSLLLALVTDGLFVKTGRNETHLKSRRLFKFELNLTPYNPSAADASVNGTLAPSSGRRFFVICTYILMSLFSAYHFYYQFGVSCICFTVLFCFLFCNKTL